jgi:hypothetical protein
MAHAAVTLAVVPGKSERNVSRLYQDEGDGYRGPSRTITTTAKEAGLSISSSGAASLRRVSFVELLGVGGPTEVLRKGEGVITVRIKGGGMTTMPNVQTIKDTSYDPATRRLRFPVSGELENTTTFLFTP